MKSIPAKQGLLNILITLIISLGLSGLAGCDDSGVVPKITPVTPHYVAVYKNVTATRIFQDPNDSSYSGIDLYNGCSTKRVDSNKDMELLDLLGDMTNFYFCSGDISGGAIGYRTRFNTLYSDISSASFDTLSVIPDDDSLLAPTEFTHENTTCGGYFHIDQTDKPVFSFYLAGKYNFSQTGHRVYGVFHVLKVERIYLQVYHSFGVRVTVDIKINRAGKNYFLPD